MFGRPKASDIAFLQKLSQGSYQGNQNSDSNIPMNMNPNGNNKTKPTHSNRKSQLSQCIINNNNVVGNIAHNDGIQMPQVSSIGGVSQSQNEIDEREVADIAAGDEMPSQTAPSLVDFSSRCLKNDEPSHSGNNTIFQSSNNSISINRTKIGESLRKSKNNNFKRGQQLSQQIQPSQLQQEQPIVSGESSLSPQLSPLDSQHRNGGNTTQQQQQMSLSQAQQSRNNDLARARSHLQQQIQQNKINNINNNGNTISNSLKDLQEKSNNYAQQPQIFHQHYQQQQQQQQQQRQPFTSSLRQSGVMGSLIKGEVLMSSSQCEYSPAGGQQQHLSSSSSLHKQSSSGELLQNNYSAGGQQYQSSQSPLPISFQYHQVVSQSISQSQLIMSQNEVNTSQKDMQQHQQQPEQQQQQQQQQQQFKSNNNGPMKYPNFSIAPGGSINPTQSTTKMHSAVSSHHSHHSASSASLQKSLNSSKTVAFYDQYLVRLSEQKSSVKPSVDISKTFIQSAGTNNNVNSVNNSNINNNHSNASAASSTYLQLLQNQQQQQQQPYQQPQAMQQPYQYQQQLSLQQQSRSTPNDSQSLYFQEKQLSQQQQQSQQPQNQQQSIQTSHRRQISYQQQSSNSSIQNDPTTTTISSNPLYPPSNDGSIPSLSSSQPITSILASSSNSSSRMLSIPEPTSAHLPSAKPFLLHEALTRKISPSKFRSVNATQQQLINSSCAQPSLSSKGSAKNLIKSKLPFGVVSPKDNNINTAATTTVTASNSNYLRDCLMETYSAKRVSSQNSSKKPTPTATTPCMNSDNQTEQTGDQMNFEGSAGNKGGKMDNKNNFNNNTNSYLLKPLIQGQQQQLQQYHPALGQQYSTEKQDHQINYQDYYQSQIIPRNTINTIAKITDPSSNSQKQHLQQEYLPWKQSHLNESQDILVISGRNSVAVDSLSNQQGDTKLGVNKSSNETPQELRIGHLTQQNNDNNNNHMNNQGLSYSTYIPQNDPNNTGGTNSSSNLFNHFNSPQSQQSQAQPSQQQQQQQYLQSQFYQSPQQQQYSLQSQVPYRPVPLSSSSLAQSQSQQQLLNYKQTGLSVSQQFLPSQQSSALTSSQVLQPDYDFQPPCSLQPQSGQYSRLESFSAASSYLFGTPSNPEPIDTTQKGSDSKLPLGLQFSSNKPSSVPSTSSSQTSSQFPANSPSQDISFVNSYVPYHPIDNSNPSSQAPKLDNNILKVTTTAVNTVPLKSLAMDSTVPSTTEQQVTLAICGKLPLVLAVDNEDNDDYDDLLMPALNCSVKSRSNQSSPTPPSISIEQQFKMRTKIQEKAINRVNITLKQSQKRKHCSTSSNSSHSSVSPSSSSLERSISEHKPKKTSNSTPITPKTTENNQTAKLANIDGFNAAASKAVLKLQQESNSIPSYSKYQAPLSSQRQYYDLCTDERKQRKAAQTTTAVNKPFNSPQSSDDTPTEGKYYDQDIKHSSPLKSSGNSKPSKNHILIGQSSFARKPQATEEQPQQSNKGSFLSAAGPSTSQQQLSQSSSQPQFQQQSQTAESGNANSAHARNLIQVTQDKQIDIEDPLVQKEFSSIVRNLLRLKSDSSKMHHIVSKNEAKSMNSSLNNAAAISKPNNTNSGNASNSKHDLLFEKLYNEIVNRLDLKDNTRAAGSVGNHPSAVSLSQSPSIQGLMLPLGAQEKIPSASSSFVEPSQKANNS